MMIVRTRPSIILFGDSITQQGFSGSSYGTSPGWVSLLSNAYARRADVLNRGYSGYNTRHALDMLPSVFGPDYNPADKNDNVLMVTVFFGANDASLPGDREHCQHVPIDEYESNLRKIIQSIRAKLPQTVDTEKAITTPPIIMITPPPIDAKKWDKSCLEIFNDTSPRTNTLAKAYGDRVKAVAKEMDCLIVDAFLLLGGDRKDGESHYGLHLEDGLHLNEQGSKLLYDGLIDAIKQELPELASMEDGDGRYGSKGIPLDGKLWKELC